MVFRILFDILRCGQYKKLEIDFVNQETCGYHEKFVERPVLLRLKTNRFLAADYVFRCKVVAAR